MPNITEFDAGNLGIRPSETGVESFAAAGRRINAFYGQQAGSLERVGSEAGNALKNAGDTAVNYMGHQEISAGAPSSLQLVADQLDKKDAAIKAIDPNDPHYGQKVEIAVKQWRDTQLEPALQEFGNQFTTEPGRKWFEDFADKTRTTMFNHSSADIATAAGIGIHNSARTIVNTATATVFRDPSMLDSQIDLVDHGITGLVQSNPVKGIEGGKIQSETLERAKEQIVKSAVQGAIMKGAPWEKIANDPRYSPYINAAETAQFERAERGQARFNLAQEKAIQVYNRQLATENLKTDADDIYAKYHHVTSDGKEYYDPQYGAELNAMVSNSKYKDAPDKASFISEHLKRFEGLTNPKRAQVQTNQAVSDALDERMFAAQNPTTEMDILKAENNHTLAKSEGDIKNKIIKLRDQVPTGPIFKAATDQVKARLEGGNPVAKLHNAGKFAEFMQDFLTRYIDARRENKLLPNALNLGDPESLISQTLKSHAPNLGQTIQQNGGVGAPLKTGPIAPPVPKTIPQASM